VFGKPGSPFVYKVSWRKERTKVDMNETEWNHYNTLTKEQRELVVPVLEFLKLQDGNSILVQARAKTVAKPSAEETMEANRIIEKVGVLHDHLTRNFGYYQGRLRILDLDSPLKTGYS
jgi:hypothetical protein